MFSPFCNVPTSSRPAASLCLVIWNRLKKIQICATQIVV